MPILVGMVGLTVGIVGIGIGLLVFIATVEWFDRRRKVVVHYPMIHVCGDCGQPWHNDHQCVNRSSQEPVQGEILRPGTQLARPVDDFDPAQYKMVED